MRPSSYAKLESELEARACGEEVSLHYSGVDLSGADLCGAELAGGDFSYAQLGRAKLVGANLAGANLRGANLREADLGGADLTGACLADAELARTRVDDAIFVGTDLRGAHLASTRGEPLSLAGAKMDDATVERSHLSLAVGRKLRSRGVLLESQAPEFSPGRPPLPSELKAPSFRPPKAPSLPAVRHNTSTVAKAPSVMPWAAPSYIPILQAQESDCRVQSLSQAPTAPKNTRKMANFLTQLVQDAKLEQALPTSLVHQSLPQASLQSLQESATPEIGLSFMGVRIEEEFPGGSVARTFRGVDQDGRRVVVKAFDPMRYGAALHLPAFQRGLRAMNRALLIKGEGYQPMELYCVSHDLTAYVVRHYEDGTLKQLVDVDLSLDSGLRLFEHLCAHYAALHRAGHLVRAIKPGNIFLDGLTPILIEIDMVDLPTLAESSGNAGGYAAYAAPEELTRSGTRSPTADVYSLGKLLEYLLSGQEPVESLSGQSPLVGRAGVPRFLVELVSRCTASDPKERFQIVEDIQHEVKRFRCEGSAAELRGPLRVETLSRVVSTPPLSGQDDLIFGQPQLIARDEWEPVEQPQKWLSRKLEMGVGAIALLFCLLIGTGLWLSPSSVDFVESVAVAAAIAAGFVTWLLPAPAHSLRSFRLATWAAFASVLYLIGPLPVAQARWAYDLRAGSVSQKQHAIKNLVRSGSRDFSGTQLEGLSLSAQDLSSATFRSSSLKGSDLSRSLIRESDFTGANVEAMQVFGSDLRLSSLGSAQGLGSLLCDNETLFPEGIYCVDGRAQLSALAQQ